jgi:AAT family amino acid transporter
MICISHVLYRRAVAAGRVPASSFPAPGGSVCSWIAIAFLLMVTVMIALDSNARICLYVMAGWAVALGIGWLVLKSRSPEVTQRRDVTLDKVG